MHAPTGEVWIGLPVEADELGARAEAIRETLVAAGASVVAADPHDDSALLTVHDADLVDFLRTASDEWARAGYPTDPGQPSVVPYIFPHPALVGDIEPLLPASRAARTGRFAFDTMTPVVPGTWEAARAAVDCALTACELVLEGAPLAYACTRPPGHHVTRGAYGGSCYLNNAAVAAAHARAARHSRVAVLDLDVHHGNGAQTIFWDDPTVLTVSVHVDPAAGWFPHYLGLEQERGAGAGEGWNRNVTVAPGGGDEAWLAAVHTGVATVGDAGAGLLVLALGVDAAAGDPNGPLEVTEDGFRRAGRLVGALRLPTVVVQEGGYDLATIGPLVRATLEGIEEGQTT